MNDLGRTRGFEHLESQPTGYRSKNHKEVERSSRRGEGGSRREGLRQSGLGEEGERAKKCQEKYRLN